MRNKKKMSSKFKKRISFDEGHELLQTNKKNKRTVIYKYRTSFFYFYLLLFLTKLIL